LLSVLSTNIRFLFMSTAPYLRSVWFWLLLCPLCWLTACQLNLFDPSKPVDPGYGPNGEPRILSLTITDIPSQNIQIDQQARVVTVTIPTGFNRTYIEPIYKLTPNTQIIESSESQKSFSLMTNRATNLARIQIKTTDKGTSNTYQFKFVPSGALQFPTLAQPLQVSTTSSGLLCLPIYNYLDGEASGVLYLTHKQTGERLQYSQYPSSQANCAGQWPNDGALFLTYYFESLYIITPGEYTVELVKPNGRRAVLNQPLLLQRGTPRLFLSQGLPLLTPVQSFSGFGGDVQPTDQVAFRVWSRGEAPQTVPAEVTIRNQSSGFGANRMAVVNAPNFSIRQPGYYLVQLLVNGVPSENIQRLIVRTSISQFGIGGIQELVNGSVADLLKPVVDLNLPLPMKRGQTYWIRSAPYYSIYDQLTGLKAQTTLTAIDDPQLAYTMENKPAWDAPNSFPTSSFSIPADAKPGRYRLALKILTPGQPVQEALPLEQDIQIQ
jgi:hypothetical protein